MQCISDCSDREGLRNERCRRHATSASGSSQCRFCDRLPAALKTAPPP
jgi:hypothetical protein